MSRLTGYEDQSNIRQLIGSLPSAKGIERACPQITWHQTWWSSVQHMHIDQFILTGDPDAVSPQGSFPGSQDLLMVVSQSGPVDGSESLVAMIHVRYRAVDGAPSLTPSVWHIERQYQRVVSGEDIGLRCSSRIPKCVRGACLRD